MLMPYCLPESTIIKSHDHVYKDMGLYKSDKNGYIHVPQSEINNESFYVKFYKDEDTLLLNSSYYSYYYPYERKKQAKHFLYRQSYIPAGPDHLF